MDIYSTGSDLIFGKIGHLFIIIAFISVIVSTISYFIATQYSNNSNTASWIGLGRKAFIVHTISAIGIFSILFILLFTHSFQYKYIWQHSSQDLPVFYIFSAMWSGQEGSTMLWIFWTAIVGCVLIFRAKSYETGVMTFVSLSQVMLCAMLLGIYIFDYKLGSSPFALLKDTMDIPIFKMNPNYIPGDGTGLNPSLQNYWMVIHPPTLFLGFALTTVPAAFAFASLWKKEYTQFAEAVLPWTLIALMILGAGILMGGAWAYEALNFGGFWAWDPVENASLVPWLILAAALHTVIVYKHTGHSLSITYAFFLMAYLLVLYSSFMTKSGVLGNASVHSFTDLGMSGLLISTILVFLIPSLGLYFYRSFKKQIPFKETEEATSSREFWLFIGALLFTLSAIHITGLTSFPVFNKLPFIKNKLAPPSDIKSHYNHVQIWLAMFAAFGTAMVQFLKFTKTNLKGFFKNFIWSLAGGIIVTIGIVAYYKINRIDYILMLVAGWFTIFSNINYIKNVMKGKVKVSGGYVSHIGFGLMMVGIVVSQGEQEVVSINRYGINYGSGFTADESAENILLYQHEPQVMGKYKVTYLGDSIHDKNIYFNVLYEQMNKKNEIVKRFTLHPNILLNQKMGNNPVPSTRKTLESDLYTHITMAPLKEDGTPVDSIVEEKHTLGVGDTLMLSRAFAIIEGINTHAEVKGIEKKPNDVAVGVKMRYVDLDTQYTIEPVYFIRDMMATSIEAEAHDHKTKIAVTRIIPESNKFEFTVEETLHKYIIMKAIKFPFINVLWLGILVMVSGIFISMQKRLSDNKRNMQPLKTATFIGSGNVATHLAQALFHKGIKIKQVCSRLMENATVLATKVNAEPIDHIDNLDETVDIIFCCTKDELIGKISKRIARKKKIKSIVHTSGTVGLEVFSDFENKFEAVGIFYPLQTFSKLNAVDFSEIPIGITTKNNFFEAELINLASKITQRTFVINDEDRQHLHLSAVLVNNFVNHLFAIAQQYCKDHQLDFNLLKPLIHQTINKIDVVPAIDAQTGPAKRKDFNIIDKHLSMLDKDILTKNIYQSLTESILKMYYKNIKL